MGESYAGITVPDGEPEALVQAAASLDAAAGMLEGAAASVQSLPASMGAWRGPASSRFAGTAGRQAMAVSTAAGEVTERVQTLRDFGVTLKEAQDKAERAIEEARDADRRIEEAEAEIESARSAASAAQARADSASGQIESTAGAHPSASADLSKANADVEDAHERERAARRKLEHAQDDLRRAKRDGAEAEDSAERAASAAAGAFAGGGAVGGGIASASTPTFAGASATGTTTTEDEDAPWYEDAWGGVKTGAQWTWDQGYGAGEEVVTGTWGTIKNTGATAWDLTGLVGGSNETKRESLDNLAERYGPYAEDPLGTLWAGTGIPTALDHAEEGAYGAAIAGVINPFKKVDLLVPDGRGGGGGDGSGSEGGQDGGEHGNRHEGDESDFSPLSPQEQRRAQEWIDQAETKETPTDRPSGKYEVEQTGPTNFELTGGGVRINADGFRPSDGTALEAKHVGSRDSSPYVPDSNAPEFVRRNVLIDTESEITRYGKIIADPDTPVRRLEIVTNDPRAVPHFEQLLRNHDVPGTVVVRGQAP